MTLVYNIGIYAYIFLVRIASFYNPKAKRWIDGRKNIFEKIDAALQKNERRIWFHCASLGEFEQARPIIEKLNKSEDVKIVVTFFSPSGYEARKNYKGADYIFYLPADTRSNARKFIELINPE